MGRVRGPDPPFPRSLPEIVGALLAPGGALPPVTSERLAGWRNDPDITAHLAGLASLDLGGADIVVNPQTEIVHREGSWTQWNAENNLVHLLEQTPRLKTLTVCIYTRVRHRRQYLVNNSFGLTPAHHCYLAHAQTADGMESM